MTGITLRCGDCLAIAAELEAGRHDTVVGELDALVAASPHRERLRAQQMLALYRAGRQADALAAYRAAREALDEIGLEPSFELRALEQRILRQDPDLDVAPVAGNGAEPRATLPAAPTALIGRELEVAARADGCVVVVLAAEDRARDMTDAPVWLLGAGGPRARRAWRAGPGVRPSP